LQQLYLAVVLKHIYLENIILLLLKFKYLILFPLAIVEGPILAVIAGFVCASGYLNVFIVYPIIVFGDIIGDTICYLFGRLGVPVFLKKIIKRLGLVPRDLNKVRIYFEANPKKTISLSKITLGIGVAGIYLAGNARVPYTRFIRICLVTSALQYIFYLGVGLLFGAAYKQISHYLDFFAGLAIVTGLSIVLFYFIQSRRKKI
jgi:membrane-associated protein